MFLSAGPQPRRREAAKAHHRLSLAALSLLCFALLGSARGIEPPQPLRIAAAISLKAPFEQIAAAFEKETGRPAVLSFASSGELMKQIEGGARIDVFVSAAHKQIDQLAERKLIHETSRRVIATNTLVLIVPVDSKDPPRSFSDLADDRVRRLAIGEPRIVPAGQYAQQTLEHLHLFERMRARLVYGTNVRQVLSYVERGEVSAGIVYRSDAMALAGTVRIVADAEQAWHDRIEYPAAIVAGTNDPAGSAEFVAFLDSPAAQAAQAALEAHGFGAPKPR